MAAREAVLFYGPRDGEMQLVDDQVKQLRQTKHGCESIYLRVLDVDKNGRPVFVFADMADPKKLA